VHYNKTKIASILIYLRVFIATNYSKVWYNRKLQLISLPEANIATCNEERTAHMFLHKQSHDTPLMFSCASNIFMHQGNSLQFSVYITIWF